MGAWRSAALMCQLGDVGQRRRVRGGGQGGEAAAPCPRLAVPQRLSTASEGEDALEREEEFVGFLSGNGSVWSGHHEKGEAQV
jgi:hypothetical protein